MRREFTLMDSFNDFLDCLSVKELTYNQKIFSYVKSIDHTIAKLKSWYDDEKREKEKWGQKK